MQNINFSYEYRDFDYNQEIYNIPYFSGCFMFFRMNIFKEIGYFDERIFMYIEDADITRRVLSKYKTVYYPDAEVYHHFEKGSHKKIKLMFYSIHGAIIYFNKWGWFN
jgi:GT2 family glycosyltransferase